MGCNSSPAHRLSKAKFQVTHCLKLCLVVLVLCQSTANSQRLDKLSCERRPTYSITTALKTPGDNGFSIKILGTPPPEFYEPGKDYQVLINGSYSNQQFLDFMLIATLKDAANERRTAGTFTHLLNHMTKADDYCQHVMTSVTFHPSYKKSVASFTWTAPPKGSGCVLFKATVLEHSDIWFSDDAGLTKMFCEKPEEVKPSPADTKDPDGDSSRTSSHKKRQSYKCCACDVAKYEVTFVGNWSRETHPKAFPTKQHESLLHWSDIIGASHSPSYSIWSYDTMATTGVKEVCEYGWPSTLEGEIKQQGRSVRTIIKAKGIWGYPSIYTTRRSARFSTDNSRPYMSLLTMIGPSPDWCVGVDSVNMCLDNCTWLDKIDLELYPWDAGTDSGVTYISSNLATYPRDKIRALTNRYPNNTASPFFGEERVKPMATVRIRRVGSRNYQEANRRCEASVTTQSPDDVTDEDVDIDLDNVKCMTTPWSDFTACSVSCGVGYKTRTRQFKHPMGSLKMCPNIKLQERDNCLGLINECGNKNESVDFCPTTPWSNWSPCSVSCGNGTTMRTRRYFHPMGPVKCSAALSDKAECTAAIPDCRKHIMMTDWKAVCSMPVEVGPCTSDSTRYFYDDNMEKCRPFNYGGCRGNENNFLSLNECESRCSVMSSSDGDPTHGEVEADRDCMVTEWSAFSECTVSCGTGLRSRSRQIKVRNSGNGDRCPKNLYETRVCASECSTQSVQTENVDCMLSEWNHWSECTTSCGDGQQMRLRMVKRQPQGQGKPCESDRKEMRQCNLGSCHLYSQCMLSEWTAWTECSVACGTGKRMRRRKVKRGPCPDDTEFTITESCEGNQCRDCVISPWSEWTDCDEPCGTMGSQTRVRTVIQPAVFGGACEIQDSKQMEKRACYMGACEKSTTTTEAASNDRTPVNCEVDSWGAWTSCSKTCGTGKQVRRRKVKQKRKNRGERCPPLKETRPCETGNKCHRRRYGRT